MNLLHDFKLDGPSEVLASLWDSIPGNIKIIFFWTLALGLATHLFMFMNKLPNHDDLHEFTLIVNHNIALGRWFINVLWWLGGHWSTPPVRGMLSLLFLSAGSCFVTAALGFKTLFFSLLAASLLVTSPVLSSMFAFMFTSVSFQFSMFCASAAVFLASRSQRGLLPGVVLLLLSLATYQAYFFFAASLLLLIIVRKTAEGAKWAEVGGLAARSAELLAYGLGVYIVATKIVTMTTHVALSNYQGVNSLSGSGLFSSVLRHLPHIFSFIFQGFIMDEFTDPLDGGSFVVLFARIALTLSIPVMLWLALRCAERGERARRYAFVMACTAFLPLLLGGIYTVGALGQYGSNGYMHVVMTYAEILLWVYAADASDLYASESACGAIRRGNIGALLLWGTALFSAVLVWNGYIFINETYLKMYMGYEKAYAFSVQLVQRIGELEPDGQKPLALVGDPRNAVDNTRIPSNRYRMMTAAFDGPELIGCNQYPVFLRDYLGCKYVSSLTGPYECRSLAEAPEVRGMPLFPARGSVRIIRDKIVVKLYNPRLGYDEEEPAQEHTYN